jgi:hypothetical protein
MANTNPHTDEQEILAEYGHLVRTHAQNMFPLIEGWDRIGGEAKAHVLLDVQQAVNAIERMGGRVVVEGFWTSSPGAVEIAANKTCPDNGVCHHSCGEMCWRVQTCAPLSDTGWDDWPQEVKDANTPAEDYEGEVIDVAWHDYPNPDTRLSE